MSAAATDAPAVHEAHAAPPGPADQQAVWGAGWEATLNKCIPAVVSLHVTVCVNFDTQKSTASEASGFIVDLERGLVLTNRHVVTPAPVVAHAKTHLLEEIDLWPVYRDPVHDFGFFRFDPAKARESQLAQIPLAPENARVGVEVRVIGNDAGQHLSILPGTLARLDRDAPQYGLGKYNDFNTFYYQAASGTSGGSSGSPVVDIGGNAVALNAGGHRDASTSFFIPLHRVLRALRLIQAGAPVPRGTLQTIFRFTPVDEVRRLGFSKATETCVRTSQQGQLKGMLVVDKVTPEGPADGTLEPGDVLVSINGAVVLDFVQLDDYLDDNVGRALEVVVERGGKTIECALTVQDLHAITPASFVLVSDAVVHELSYMMAVSYQVPVGGVYVAKPGFMFGNGGLRRRCVVKTINNVKTDTLQDFRKVVATLEDGAKVPVRMYHLSDVSIDFVVTVTVDRHWFACKTAQRNDVTGVWDFESVPAPSATFQPQPATTTLMHVDNITPAIAAVLPALCSVDFLVPFTIDGMSSLKYVGTGIVLDAERGLVLVDGNTITCSIGDAQITFQASVTVPCKLVYHSSERNFAVLAYDPKLLGATPVQAAQLSSQPLRQMDQVMMIGYKRGEGILSRETVVTAVRETFVNETSPPRNRPVNVEIIQVDYPITCDGGVLTDKSGRVQALWGSFALQEHGQNTEFFAGIDIGLVLPVLRPLQEGRQPMLRSMMTEFVPQQLSDARSLGLTDAWVHTLETANPSKRSIMQVRRVLAGTPATGVLKDGDLLLTINDRPVTCYRDLDAEMDAASVTVRILRDSAEITLKVPTAVVDGLGTSRIIGWAGAIVQAPHRAAAERRRVLPEGVYVSAWYYGSPVHQSGLSATWWIVEVDGQRVPTLDAFLDVVKKLDDSKYVRIKTVDFSDRVQVLTVRPNQRYYPLWELVQDAALPAGFRLVEHQT